MSDEKPSFFAIIPANVRYDSNLKPMEKLLYGEITCLSNKNGYCYATNSYFANLYEKDDKTVSRWISNLQKNGYVKVQLVKENNTVVERRIYILGDEKITTYCQKNHYPSDLKVTTPSDLKVTDNNTRFNNTSNNNIYSSGEEIKPKEQKYKYGKNQNVLLTDSEYQRLLEEKGKTSVEMAIDFLSDYKIEKGYKTKSDNLTLRRWVFDAIGKIENQIKPKPKPMTFVEKKEYMLSKYANDSRFDSAFMLNNYSKWLKAGLPMDNLYFEWQEKMKKEIENES